MQKHLVIGASGMIGSHLYRALKENYADVRGTYFTNPSPELTQLDIRDREAVYNLLADFYPDVVHIVSAMTHVGECQVDTLSAWQTNVLGVANIVNAQPRHKRIVYYSSDYVFGGPARSGGIEQLLPSEDDPPDRVRLNWYGETKLAAEHYIATQAKNFLIIRTCQVYGRDPNRKNFVARLVDALRKGEEVYVPDIYGTPTFVNDLVDASLLLNKIEATGVHHLAGHTFTSRTSFALAIANAWALDERLLKLEEAGIRPTNGGLSSVRNSSLPGYPEVFKTVPLEQIA